MDDKQKAIDVLCRTQGMGSSQAETALATFTADEITKLANAETGVDVFAVLNAVADRKIADAVKRDND